MENRTKWEKFRRWGIIQKVTLQRGYGWLNVPMIGFIAASQFKLLFPAFFKGIWNLLILTIAATLGLWFIGYLDRKLLLLHEENTYGTTTNPLMMKVVNKANDTKT